MCIRLRVIVVFFVVFGVFVSSLTSCKHQPYIPTAVIDTTGNGGGGNDTTIQQTPQHPCSPDSIYFSRQVLPILNSNCAVAGCHDGTSKEDDVKSLFTSYDNVMKSQAVKKNWNTEESLYWYITTTEDNTMPPKDHNQLTAEQKAVILKWIQQGKQNLFCDECDTTNVTFAGAIRPIIDANCKGCHSGASAGGKINLVSFDDVKVIPTSGKMLGAILQENKKDFKAMPMNTKLSDCDITKIKIWLRAGFPNN